MLRRPRAGGPARLVRWLSALATLCVQTGCAQTLELPDLSDLDEFRETQIGPESMAQFLGLRATVQETGYEVVSSAVPFCGPYLAPELGGLYATDASFEEETVRELAKRTYGYDGTGIQIMHVAPGSPLDAAGVRAGDRITASAGTPLETTEDLAEVVPDQPGELLALTVTRGDETLEVEVEPEPVCGMRVALTPFFDLVPREIGGSIAVSFTLVRNSDRDELGISIAHQLAHRLVELSSEPVEDPEATADELGLLIAANAGFDVTKAPSWWLGIAAEDPTLIPPPEGRAARREVSKNVHGNIAARLPAIRATVDRILEISASR